MTALLTEPPPSRPPARAGPAPEPGGGPERAGGPEPLGGAADELRREFAAARVSFTWLGVRKALTAEQRAAAAEGFGAAGPYLSAAKKLLDTADPAFRAVTAVRSAVVAYWRGASLPYPEPGVRLLRQADVAGFDARMAAFRGDLAAAVAGLDGRLADLQADARGRLGALYDPADYPAAAAGLFAVAWDYPAVADPPEHLLRLNPRLYRQERARVAARFDEAVRLAEEAFAAEFGRLVGHLADRLAPGPGGERRALRDSSLTNLQAFFDRFRHLNVRSDPELERLVEAARRAVAGADPAGLRDAAGLRQAVARDLGAVRASLDALMVEGPRRRVLRPARGTPAAAAAAAAGAPG